jgi:hypothetical protein
LRLATILQEKKEKTMSWSVAAIGKPAAVANKLAEEFSRNPCSEPEETIRQAVAGIVATSLAAFPPNYAVKVTASGSQSCPDFNKAPEEKTNKLNVTIEPQWGFVE